MPYKILIFLLVLMTQCIHCFGSVSLGVTAVGAVGAALYASVDKLRCAFYECCLPNSEWIKPNLTALTLKFDENLHGQHLVKDVIVRALRGHLSNDQPQKALVMSFHGWTGGGKNFVSKFVAESLFKLGLRSQYVHIFVSTIHFPHEKESDIYKLNLQDWIRGNVTRCHRSLFIFDEIDKMPLGTIDAIKPFIDYHENINGVDFRHSIFLFLSNTGGPEITRRMLTMWKDGRQRDDIQLQDMEDLIQKGAFNEKGGLHKSELIQHSLVDYYVPFLPLERKHVELCAKDEIRRRLHNPTKDLVNRVANEMVYFPPENKLFSTTGCKRVAQKVGFILANEYYDTLFD